MSAATLLHFVPISPKPTPNPNPIPNPNPNPNHPNPNPNPNPNLVAAHVELAPAEVGVARR